MSTNTLELYVSDIVSAMASYDTMKLRRSLLEVGPWTEITAPIATSATLTGTTDSPFTAVGLTLQLKVDSEAQVDVTFTGTDPLTVDQVVAQINTAVGSTVAFDDSGKVLLESTLTGTQSKMEIVGGSAATVLGFTADQRDIGDEPYVDLVAGQNAYPFYDRDGDYGEYYEVAFFNTATSLQSQWSDPFQAVPGTAVDSANLSVGSIDLTDARGISLAEQKITFYPLHEPLKVDGFAIALAKEPITIETNNSGHAEVTLVRGLRVRVVFEETSIIREIVVPDAATFDLLDLISASPDPYNPVEPDYPDAIRRSL